jgi:hypothetical protein
MKFRLIFILKFYLLFCIAQGIASQSKPSDSIQIYLLTASQGEETYAAFGHSALRVCIPQKEIDYVFNYGTFNFDTPHFYFKFSTGRLLYSLSIQKGEPFLDSYNTWGQAIYEQKLLLNQSECEKLFHLLIENHEEENRYYRYSFFYDNCATRIRDIVEKSTEGRVIYDTTFIKSPKTFRQLISPYLGYTPWIEFGIDLLLGTGTDNVATPAQYMFQPKYLKDMFASARIINGDSVRMLTESPRELFPTKLTFEKPGFMGSPLSIFMILWLVILMISIFQLKKNWKLIWLDRFIFIVTGLLGFLMAFLWIWSLHREVENNFNIFWASPINMLIAVCLFIKPSYHWLKKLLLIFTIMISLFIPCSFLFTQVFPAGAYFICLILVTRSLVLYKTLKPSMHNQ